MHLSSAHRSSESYLNHQTHDVVSQPGSHDSASDSVLVSGSGLHPIIIPSGRRRSRTHFDAHVEPLANNATSSRPSKRSLKSELMRSQSNRQTLVKQFSETQRSSTEKLLRAQGHGKRKRHDLPLTVPAQSTTAAVKRHLREARYSLPMEQEEDDAIDSASSSDSGESTSEQDLGEDSGVHESVSGTSSNSSNSEVHSSTSESESDEKSLITTSKSDDDDQVERSNSPNRSVSRIAYVRVPSAVSAEEKAKLKAILVRYDATAMLILDVQQKRAPFQQRAGLKRLFQLVLKGQVDEILIANPTQLCNTKEGFELIEWTFHMIGARVLITPSLDVF